MPIGVSGAWDAFGATYGPYSSSPQEISLPGIPDPTHVYRVKSVLPLSP